MATIKITDLNSIDSETFFNTKLSSEEIAAIIGGGFWGKVIGGVVGAVVGGPVGVIVGAYLGNGVENSYREDEAMDDHTCRQVHDDLIVCEV